MAVIDRLATTLGKAPKKLILGPDRQLPQDVLNELARAAAAKGGPLSADEMHAIIYGNETPEQQAARPRAPRVWTLPDGGNVVWSGGRDKATHDGKDADEVLGGLF
jgi:hypothetical protein